MPKRKIEYNPSQEPESGIQPTGQNPSKPTPGPWMVEYTLARGLRVVYGEPAVDGFRNDVPCRGVDEDMGQLEANVRLMAASPELLDALKGVMGLVELLMARTDVPEEARALYPTNHRWITAVEAIDKAEGRHV